MPLSDSEVERVIDAIVADVVCTLGWSHKDARTFIGRAGSVKEYASVADEVLTLAYQVMGNVQLAIHESPPHRPWPECPQHGEHPLNFDYDLVWRCPREDQDDPDGFFRSVPLGWLDAVWQDPR